MASSKKEKIEDMFIALIKEANENLNADDIVMVRASSLGGVLARYVEMQYELDHIRTTKKKGMG